MRLAGTYHPISYLLNKIPQYIPGVEEVNAIWCDEDRNIKSTFTDDPAEGENKLMFQRWRKETVKLLWLNSFDPFQSASLDLKQMSLTDEDDLNTLLLFFNGIHDDSQDIIAITFPKNLFLKNFNVEFSGISTQEKLVLSNLLSSILHTEHKQSIEEQLFLKQLNHHNKYNKEKVSSLEEQLNTAENLYSSAISSILKELLLRYEKQWNTSFILDETLVKHFAKEKVSLSNVKDQIERMATMAYHLNFGEKEIVIDESFIHAIDTNKQHFTKENDTLPDQDKVIQLLDRYEESAVKIEKSQGTMNAKEIAKRLDPPVTPPAITDAVKKNNRKIAYLLRQYPGRWSLIRSAIRPIQRIDSNQSNSRIRVS